MTAKKTPAAPAKKPAAAAPKKAAAPAKKAAAPAKKQAAPAKAKAEKADMILYTIRLQPSVIDKIKAKAEKDGVTHAKVARDTLVKAYG